MTYPPFRRATSPDACAWTARGRGNPPVRRVKQSLVQRPAGNAPCRRLYAASARSVQPTILIGEVRYSSQLAWPEDHRRALRIVGDDECERARLGIWGQFRSIIPNSPPSFGIGLAHLKDVYVLLEHRCELRHALGLEIEDELAWRKGRFPVVPAHQAHGSQCFGGI